MSRNAIEYAHNRSIRCDCAHFGQCALLAEDSHSIGERLGSKGLAGGDLRYGHLKATPLRRT